MEVLTAAVQKGGVGKTTTTAALAQAAAYRGFRVLAIDLDPQGNLSLALDAATGGAGSYDFLEGARADDVIQKKGGLDIIPASWNLSTAETKPGSARRLQKALEPLTLRYDYVMVDTPPTAGEMQYNALQAATGLIIPLGADIYNLQSLYQIADTAEQIKKSNPALAIKGFILTQYNDRSTIAKQMSKTIIEQAQKLNIPYLGVIRNAVVIKEAAALRKSLFEYAPNSKPAIDYMALFDKL